MLPYNPRATNRSGEVYGEYLALAGQLQGKGLSAAGAGFASGISALGNAAGEALEKANENKMTSDYLDQLAAEYNRTPGMDGVTPLMPDEELQKFSELPLAKKSAVLAPRQAMFDQMLKNSYLERSIDLQMERMGYGNQLRQPAPNQVPMGYGAPTGQPATTVPFNVTVPINP